MISKQHWTESSKETISSFTDTREHMLGFQPYGPQTHGLITQHKIYARSCVRNAGGLATSGSLAGLEAQ